MPGSIITSVLNAPYLSSVWNGSFRISNPRKGTETTVGTVSNWESGRKVSAYLIPARGLKLIT